MMPAQEAAYDPVNSADVHMHLPPSDRRGKNKFLKKAMFVIMGILLIIVSAVVITVVVLSQETVDGASEKNYSTNAPKPTTLDKTTPGSSHVDVQVSSLPDGSSSLLIGAFNIKTFGRSKMSKKDAPNHIRSILDRYDIVLIQEVKDSTQKSQRDLWALLNTTGEWGMVESERLGRSNYKEQYIFFYKLPAAQVTGTFQHPDTSNDVYEREPFSAEFAYMLGSHPTKRIVLLALHSKPSDAVSELEHLPQAIRDTHQHFPNSQGVISMGDFNADCSYLNKKERQSLEIFSQDSGFSSLIPDSVDTTVGNTDCAYDRIVVYDPSGTVRVSDAAVFPFPSVLDLTDDEALVVSDHYPVEFKLY